jgi:replication-associated recombination protein RarA
MKKPTRLPACGSPKITGLPLVPCVTASDPANWQPQRWQDLIGDARTAAAILFTRIDRQFDSGINQRLVFTGPPGCGKSQLSKLIAHRLCGHPSDIERVSGKNVNAEKVRDWMNTVHLPHLWGGYSVKIIEEIDACTPDAGVLMLSYLDEVREAKAVAVLASSNKPLDELFADRRLFSRFQPFTFTPATYSDIVGLLTDRFGLPQGDAEGIALGCDGDVRAALNDAQNFLDLQAAQLAA